MKTAAQLILSAGIIIWLLAHAFAAAAGTRERLDFERKVNPYPAHSLINRHHR